MSKIDQDDLATREARMFQTIFQLAAEHGCTVKVHDDGHWIEICGPVDNQVALAQAMSDSLEWCEFHGMV